MKKPRMARWSYRWELNPQPIDYKSIALPVELRQHVAGVAGIEPALRESKSRALPFGYTPMCADQTYKYAA